MTFTTYIIVTVFILLSSYQSTLPTPTTVSVG